MPSYIALLRKESKSDFGVNFPDFPGCITAGRTLEEARVLAKEALDAHVALMMEDGDAIPAPSTLDQVAMDPESEGALPFLVDLTMPEEPVLRINITVPKRDLATIDAAAERSQQSRSAFLVKSALVAAGAGLTEPMALAGRSMAEQKRGAYRVAKRSAVREASRPKPRTVAAASRRR
jgi:predicted RNase H-like HicB family nuclease